MTAQVERKGARKNANVGSCLLPRRSRERRGRLPDPLRRALEIRVAMLEEEQASDRSEFDQLYERSDDLLVQISERQQRLRRFREILLADGEPNARPT